MKEGVSMKKTLIILSILLVFGLLIGGVFLFSSISSVDVSEQYFVETLGPIILHSCGSAPGYPNNCDPL